MGVPLAHLDLDIFISTLYVLTVWIPATTGVDLSRPKNLSELLNPFSHFNVQLMKVTLPSCFAFISMVAFASDAGVPGWVGLLVALIISGLLIGSVVAGLAKKKPDPIRGSENADGLDYTTRLHKLEDGLLSDAKRRPNR